MAAKTTSRSTPRKAGHPVWVFAGLIAGALLLTGLMYTPWFKDLIEVTSDWGEDIMADNPVAGAIVFFIFSALSALLAFATSVVMVPAANMAWGEPLTVLLLWSGWLTGSVAAYAVGYLAYPMLVRWGYKEALDKYNKIVSHRMPFWLVFVLCLAIPSEVPGYVLGGVRYSLPRFIAAMGIAEGLYAAGVVWMGDSLTEAKPGVLLAGAAAMIAVGAIAMLVLRRATAAKAKS
jgi:uncharacterized membrane protein YdjX (TVP38/TMEM64 family)